MDKVPKIGSTGERHRDKQLAYQLPKQDLSLDYCKHVEPQNQASYEDFVAARNEIALDIGKIRVGNIHSIICKIQIFLFLKAMSKMRHTPLIVYSVMNGSRREIWLWSLQSSATK